MIKKNHVLDLLPKQYLFAEIANRKKAYLEKVKNLGLDTEIYPIISLDIGDVALPLPKLISQAMEKSAKEFSLESGFKGYGSTKGDVDLRESIAENLYQNIVDKEDIFLSDGAKGDVGRLLMLLGTDLCIALQDPIYPVFLDLAILQKARKIVSLPCNKATKFSLDLENPDLLNQADEIDCMFLCSPNNPVGVTFTKDKLEEIVAFANKHQILLIYDTAYREFISDELIPKSIYEIPGAKTCAIEIGSFSKFAGFTGVRLGYSIVPSELLYQDGSKIQQSYNRVVAGTLFNGPSRLSVTGGKSALTKDGYLACKKQVEYYLENACLLKAALKELGFSVYGGERSPFIWVEVAGKSSWEIYEFLLENAQISAVPGVGFGKEGEGFIRFSAFAKRQAVLDAISRLKKLPIIV